jgi:hypothetical protein
MASDPETPDPSPANGASGKPPITSVPPTDAGLGRELGGDLPCVACGYNLRGLSIRSMCPECGTNVRATILSVVDPQANELRPIRFPRLTATGVLLWAFGGVAVCLMSWLPQAADILRQLGMQSVNRPSAALGVMLGLGTSALGSLTLIRPHTGVHRLHALMAAAATLLYLPLGRTLWRYHTMMDTSGGQHYLAHWTPNAEASRLLALACAMIAGIIMLQRPNARLLVARSMVLRTGRVDRQTLYAMAIAACVMAIGSLLGRVDADTNASLVGEVARTAGVVAIAFGGLLLSIGALGSLLDCARIAGAILIPKRSLRQIIREGRPAPRTRFMKMIDPTPPPAAGGGGSLISQPSPVGRAAGGSGQAPSGGSAP